MKNDKLISLLNAGPLQPEENSLNLNRDREGRKRCADKDGVECLYKDYEAKKTRNELDYEIQMCLEVKL